MGRRRNSGSWRGNQYTVEVRIRPAFERPANAQGVEELRTTFTTGTSVTPSSLDFVGEMEVTLEPAEEPYYDPSLSGGTCFGPSSGTVSNTTAQLRLPGVTGGDASYGYNLQIVVTADVPFNFNQAAVASPCAYTCEIPCARISARRSASCGAVEVVGAEPGTVATLHNLGSSNREYSPCFAVQATDFSGNTAMGEPVCLKEKVPPVGRPERQDAPTPLGKFPGDDTGHSEAASGCRFAPSATHTSGWLLALVALGVGSLRRRSAKTR
ncbi:MAG: hypothetical protein RJA70_3525 [Pseudomonadota bacterium]